MRGASHALGLVVLAACASPSPIDTTGEPTSVTSTEWFADNGLGNAVAVIQHPAGEHRDGITYVAYQGPLEDPYVVTYDHDADSWSGPFQAGTSIMGKDPTRRIDNHGKPTMILDDLGYIHVFYGGHGGVASHGPNPLGNIHYGENRHAVSKRPYDITEWEDLDTLPPFGTYNQVVKMDNGDLYLFYRHGAHRSDWVYQVSTDHGRSFSEPVTFLKHKRRNDLRAEDSWYPYIAHGQGDELIVSYDYHLCWDRDAGIDERGHTSQRHDVYYMTFDTRTGEWRNVEDEVLPTPMVREVADAKTRVARTGTDWTFNQTAKLGPDGHPHIGIRIGTDDGSRFGGPKQASYFRWTGTDWQGGRIDPEAGGLPNAAGDFLVGERGEVRYLLGYNRPGQTSAVGWWSSTNGGQSFTQGDILLARESEGFAVSSFLRNAHPDARMVVARRPPGEDRRFMYLIGDDGVVGRSDN